MSNQLGLTCTFGASCYSTHNTSKSSTVMSNQLGLTCTCMTSEKKFTSSHIPSKNVSVDRDKYRNNYKIFF